jgi:hypothetical protein
VDGNTGFAVFWAGVSGVTIIVLGVDPQLIVLSCLGSLVTVSARQSGAQTLLAKGASIVSWCAAFVGAAVIANALGAFLGLHAKVVSGLALFFGCLLYTSPSPRDH